jgi:hypothetical protein
MQTSMRIDQANRDALARIAAEELGGASLDETVRVLLFEHETIKAVARLEADPEALADWQHEAHEWVELDTAVTE